MKKIELKDHVIEIEDTWEILYNDAPEMCGFSAVGVVWNRNYSKFVFFLRKPYHTLCSSELNEIEDAYREKMGINEGEELEIKYYAFPSDFELEKSIEMEKEHDIDLEMLPKG